MNVVHKANIYFLGLGHRLFKELLIGCWNTKVIIQEPWHYIKQTQPRGNYDINEMSSSWWLQDAEVTEEIAHV